MSCINKSQDMILFKGLTKKIIGNLPKSIMLALILGSNNINAADTINNAGDTLAGPVNLAPNDRIFISGTVDGGGTSGVAKTYADGDVLVAIYPNGTLKGLTGITVSPNTGTTIISMGEGLGGTGIATLGEAGNTALNAVTPSNNCKIIMLLTKNSAVYGNINIPDSTTDNFLQALDSNIYNDIIMQGASGSNTINLIRTNAGDIFANPGANGASLDLILQGNSVVNSLNNIDLTRDKFRVYALIENNVVNGPTVTAGAVTINGDQIFIPFIGQTPPIGNSTLFTASGGLTVNAPLPTLNSTAMLDFVFNITGTTVDLTTTRRPLNSANLVNLPNTQLVGGLLYGLVDAANQEGINIFNSMGVIASPLELENSFSQIANQFVGNYIFDSMTHNVQSIYGVIKREANFVQNLKFLSMNLNSSNSTTIDNYLKNRTWGKVFGDKIKRDDKPEKFGLDSNNLGLAFGYDRQISDNFWAGLALAYSHTSVDVGKGYNYHLKVDSYMPSIYAKYSNGKQYLDFNGTFAVNKYKTFRKINLGATKREARSEYYGYSPNARVEAGFNMAKYGININPLASLLYSYLKQDKYDETGAGSLDLKNVKNKDVQKLVGEVGLRISRVDSLGTLTIIPEFSISKLYNFLNKSHFSTAFLPLMNTSFTTRGLKQDRGTVHFGFGLNILNSNSFNSFFNYDFYKKTTSTQRSHFVQLGVRYLA